MIEKTIPEIMLLNDNFSRLLGIKIIKQNSSEIVLNLKIKKKFMNGFNLLHGGVTFSLADTALAFASNFNGKKSVTIDSSISYFIKCNTGDILTAKTREINSSKKFGIYEVEILNQKNKLIAKFKGTVYRFIENIKS